MHYDLGKGRVIRSENAAKPLAQKSKYMAQYILALPSVARALDYGCGKLRYFTEMRARAEYLVLVDSDVQLSREQMLGQHHDTIRHLVSRYKHVVCQDIDQFIADKSMFDRVYCLNVLSAIPIMTVRDKVMELLRLRLKIGGEAIIVIQYRNSEFKKMERSPNATRYADGILLKSLKGYSFYAPIVPAKLEAYAKSHGFEITAQNLNEGSVYLRCKKI